MGGKSRDKVPRDNSSEVFSLLNCNGIGCLGIENRDDMRLSSLAAALLRCLPPASAKIAASRVRVNSRGVSAAT